MRIVAEVRRNLRCSNFYIQHEEKHFKISLEKDQVNLRTNESDKQSISLNGEFEVDIKSLSSLVVEKENTSFRITIIPKEDQSDFVDPATVNVPVPPPVKENHPVQLKCITCRTNLLEKKTLSFSRVLEYPSGSVDVSEFFCHNGPDFSSKLAPKATDLFYGFQFLVINSGILSNWKEKDHHFYCRRCLSYLGQRIQGEVVKIWSDNVRIDFEDTVVPRIDKRLLVVQLFHKIIADCSVNRDIHCIQFSKVILETILPTRQKRFLMVNILEKNLEIMRSSDVASAFELEKSRAYKVLFKFEEEEENALLVFWKNDFNVHSIAVSHKMFTNVLNVLVEGNRIFPSIYRLTKDFMTSFIFYSS
ncbi:hypothetical protein ACFFRR_003884 [Megaselia abdita]